MTDVIGRATLETTADVSGFEAAMAKASTAAKKFEQTTDRAAKGASNALGKSGDGAAQASDRMASASKRFLASLERQSMAAGKTRSEYLELRAAQMGLSDQAAPMIAKIRESEKGIVNLGMSSKQTAMAMRQLPMQMTDIVTGLVSGQPAYMVAIQQGGQLRDVFGGFGPAIRAVLGLFTPLRLAIGGGAAAFGLLAKAIYDGHQETAELNKALILTGGYIGKTSGQMQQMAADISKSVGTQAKATETLVRIAQGGKLAGDRIQDVATAIVALSDATGRSVDELAEEFESLAKSPTEAIVKLNEKYHFLTVSVYDQIRALEEQGRVTDAARLAFESLTNASERMTGRVVDDLGSIERSWNAIKRVVDGVWNTMMNIGREANLGAQLEAARRRLESMLPGGSAFGRFAQEEIDQQRKLVAFLEARVATTEGLAAASGEWTRRQQAGIDAQREIDRIMERSLSKQVLMNRELKQARENIAKIRAAGGTVSEEQVAKIEQSIRSQYAEKGSGPKRKDEAAERYLQTLQEQIDRTAELTAYERLLVDLEAGRLGKVNAGLFEQLTAMTRLIDARREEIALAEQRSALDRLIESAQQREIERNERVAQQMEDVANRWLDTIDPMRAFIRHVEEVDRVVEELQQRGWVFTPEQIAAIKELGNGVREETAKVSDAAQQLGLTFESAFESAIVGGEKFSKVLDAIGQDLLRLTIRESITKPAAAWLSSALNLGGLFGGGKASGGPVSAGTTYLVGERGPELFTPHTSGSIVPNGKLGGGVNITNNYTFAPGVNAAQLKHFAEQIKADTKADVLDGMRRGRYVTA